MTVDCSRFAVGNERPNTMAYDETRLLQQLRSALRRQTQQLMDGLRRDVANVVKAMDKQANALVDSLMAEIGRTATGSDGEREKMAERIKELESERDRWVRTSATTKNALDKSTAYGKKHMMAESRLRAELEMLKEKDRLRVKREKLKEKVLIQKKSEQIKRERESLELKTGVLAEDRAPGGPTSTVDRKQSPGVNHLTKDSTIYDLMTTKLEPQSLAASMYQRCLLTRRELESVQSKARCPIEAAEELLDIVVGQPIEVYECFLESLKLSGQQHVYDWLVNEGYKVNNLHFDHTDAVRQHYVYLVENLDTKFSGLVGILFAEKVLEVRETEEIDAEFTSMRQNEKLLSILSRKSRDDYERFLGALDKTGQGHVRIILTGNEGPEQHSQQTISQEGKPNTDETNDRPIGEPEAPEDPSAENIPINNQAISRTDERHFGLRHCACTNPMMTEGATIAKLSEELEMAVERERRLLIDKTSLECKLLGVVVDLLASDRVLEDYERDRVQTQDTYDAQLQMLTWILKQKCTEQLAHFLFRLDCSGQHLAANEVRDICDIPVAELVQSLPTNDLVRGVAYMDSKLFVVCWEQNTIQRYGDPNQDRLQDIKITDMTDPTDIATCVQSNTLYVAGWSSRRNENTVWRVSLDGHVTRFLPRNHSTTRVDPRSLSVTSCRLLVTSFDDELLLYGADGAEIRRLPLPGLELQHAVETRDETVVVCHRKPQPEVREVDADGRAIRVYGDRPSTTSPPLQWPCYLCVDYSAGEDGGVIFVTDNNGERVLLLSGRLELVSVLLSVENGRLAQLPSRLCYVPDGGRLVVGSELSPCVQVFGLRTDAGTERGSAD